MALLAALAGMGCQNKKPVVQVESSAGLYSYASEYPEALSGQMTRYNENAAKTRDSITGFSAYPEALDDPDWAVVTDVYENADAEGRGYGFAGKVEEERAVRAFFDREKDDIARRVNGVVKSAVEKAECSDEVDTYGKVSYALKESVDKRLEESLAASNQAMVVIERNEKSLGKKNAEALEAQSGNIAYAAYVVFIEMPKLSDEVARRIDEVKDVQETLDRERAAEKTRLDAPETSKAEKKKIEEHIKEIDNAKSAIAVFEGEAKQLVEKAETEIPSIRKEYEDAFKALMDEVNKRLKAAPPPAS